MKEGMRMHKLEIQP